MTDIILRRKDGLGQTILEQDLASGDPIFGIEDGQQYEVFARALDDGGAPVEFTALDPLVYSLKAQVIMPVVNLGDTISVDTQYNSPQWPELNSYVQPSNFANNLDPDGDQGPGGTDAYGAADVTASIIDPNGDTYEFGTPLAVEGSYQVRFQVLRNDPVTGQHTYIVDGGSFVPVGGAAGPLPGQTVVLAGTPQEGETLSVETGSIVVQSFDWRMNGVSTGETGPSFTLPSGSGMAMGEMAPNRYDCVITDTEGRLYTTPAQTVLMFHAIAAHRAMDSAAEALCRHVDATHIAIASGDWSNTAIWHDGEVPQDGARVLIQHGVTVNYNVATSPRLDTVRVDGVLDMQRDIDLQILVETLYVHRGGAWRAGSFANPVDAAVTHEIIISNRHYQTDPDNPTDIDLLSDPELLGRGVIHTGEVRLYGAPTTDKLQIKFGSTVGIGDTSCVLRGQTTNWAAGTRVFIAGCFQDSTRVQSEEIVLDTVTYDTANDETTITWTGGLIYDHFNLNSDSATHMPYHQPDVVCMDRNIVIRSENGSHDQAINPAWQRGHHMSLHMTSQAFIYHVAFEHMGRTDKQISAGVFRNGQFVVLDESNNWALLTQPKTPRSNIQSRYPLHLHFMGFNRPTGQVPTVYGCFIHGTPGWGGVHHGCEADLYKSDVYKYKGAGWVSETGDELGAWVELGGFSCIGTLVTAAPLKSAEDTKGGHLGDFGRTGAAFVMRGRAMRTNACVAGNCPRGFDFWHRNNLGSTNNISPVRMLPRDTVDINDIAYLRVSQWGFDFDQTIPWVDYPIIHFIGNRAYGCITAHSVVKGDSKQNHDLNIVLDGLVAWNVEQGLWLNYIGSYLIRNYDIACIGEYRYTRSDGTQSRRYRLSNMKGMGISRSEQVAIVKGTGQVLGTPANQKINLSSGSLGFVDSDLFTAWDYGAAETVEQMPRFMVIGYDASDIRFTTEGGTTNTAQQVTAIYPTLPTYRRTTTDLPFLIGSSDVNASQNASLNLISPNWQEFTKRDSLGTTRLNKLWDQVGLPFDGLYDSVVRRQLVNDGYWTWDDGGTIRNIMLLPFYFSDRLYGYPEKFYHALELTNADLSGLDNNGAYDPAATVDGASDFSVTVTQDGSFAFDIDTLSGAAARAGYDLTLERAFYAPQRALHPDFDVENDGITYEPDPGYVGPDEMIYWLRHENTTTGAKGPVERVIVTVDVQQG